MDTFEYEMTSKTGAQYVRCWKGGPLMPNRHTPGPWPDDLDYYLNTAFEVAKGEERWHWPPRRIEDAEVIANARIMAAAPDLLAALKESANALADIINAAGNDQPYSATELVELFADIWCRADAAYAKATGEKA